MGLGGRNVATLGDGLLKISCCQTRFEVLG
jgi:hypothetical protein